MKGSRIFITGVAGFLGSHVAKWALSEGHEVLGADNLSLGHKNNIPGGVQFYEYDLIDLEKNKKYLKSIDVVFHAASYPYDNFSLFIPFRTVQNTFSITASLLSASLFNHVKRFIYCSSMSRYGDNVAPFTEDMTPKTLTPYSVAKVAGENLVKSLSQVHNFEYVICIPHNIFGPQQIYNDPYRNAVSLIINQMLKNKSPLIYGDGEQKRAFSPIQDLIPLFPKLLFGKLAKNQTINIGPDEEVISLNTLVQLLNKILGKNLKPNFKTFRKQEVKLAFCSSDKSRRLLNYKKSISLETALRNLVSYINEKGPSYFSYHQTVELERDYFPENWKQKSF
ncbi:MAG: NAD-dependent epimerase/dehydratase family protein [Bdellovibrionales bacterium]|nr:NAD-dependent epimerase/dehydratase family protein [Bdellovibrionales bacterium]